MFVVMASSNMFFTCSPSMAIEGDFESTQTSILAFALYTTCDWTLAIFSIPYNS
jgi:hypothetical protein